MRAQGYVLKCILKELPTKAGAGYDLGHTVQVTENGE